MRCLLLLATASLAATTTPVAAQRRPAAGPVYMDYVTGGRAISPNGRFEITVTGPKKSLEAWVTVHPSDFPGGAIQVWPIQRGVEVLWRPDSRAFALTDERYANVSYVLVLGTDFHMSGARPGVPIADLTPPVRKAFDGRVQKYYGTLNYETYVSYAKALRWVANDRLLVGLNARTSEPTHQLGPAAGVRDWYLAYLVDVPHRKVVRELSDSEVLAEYGIDLAKESW